MPTNNNHIKIIANNKKASFNYFLDEFFECGLVLKGTEIKSLRAHNPAISAVIFFAAFVLSFAGTGLGDRETAAVLSAPPSDGTGSQ